MMASYPIFADRSDTEKQNLFLTANWMDILFRIIPARKNKGIAMDIIPKFIEGNGANYVTGGGQTRSTRDRVFIYETEGGCKPIKRLKRKSKTKLEEESEETSINREDSDVQPNKKIAVSLPPPSEQTRESSLSIKDHYFQLPEPFYHAQPLPIPVISPRSQSSFSQAAAVIANFGQIQPELSTIPSQNTDDGSVSNQNDSISLLVKNEAVSECYYEFDENGNAIKKFNPREITTSSSDTYIPPSLALTTSVTSMPSRMSSVTSTFEKFVENLEHVDVEVVGDQLAMLREASADSDI
jgi:hypothetical protein